MKKWTKDEDDLLSEKYPSIGKAACCELLGRSEGQVRWRASMLGLKCDKNSEHFKEWQRRAAASKVGKKRPDQAIVMKRLHESGAFKFSEERRAKNGERVKKWIAENGHPRGMLGKKHTESVKEAMSKAAIKRAAEMSEQIKMEIVAKAARTREKNGTNMNNRQKTTWKGSWREIGGIRKFYRSSWEANYARYLQFLLDRNEISKWEHEPETFWFEKIKRGCVSYLPDFRVTRNDGSVYFVEVKGWMDDRSKTKLKRMSKYFPCVEILLVDGKAYRGLSKAISGIVAGWE